VVPKLLEQYKPHIVILAGLAADRNYFAVEKGADRDGYHQIPDEERKVFTKAEAKKAWGKSPDRLDSSIDLDDVLARWKRLKMSANLRVSDDVGNYVCGFAYYLSLEKFWKSADSRPVVFIHVPPLPSKKDVEEGVEATIALVQAVVASRTEATTPIRS
jgi:pyrrolidone-carboxylate peptidase